MPGSGGVQQRAHKPPGTSGAIAVTSLKTIPKGGPAEGPHDLSAVLASHLYLNQAATATIKGEWHRQLAGFTPKQKEEEAL